MDLCYLIGLAVCTFINSYCYNYLFVYVSVTHVCLLLRVDLPETCHTEGERIYERVCHAPPPFFCLKTPRILTGVCELFITTRK